MPPRRYPCTKVAQGQALAQRPGERRIEAKNLVEQREPGAGEETLRARSRRWSFGGRAQDGNACCNSWVSRRATRPVAPARPPPRRGDGRRPERIGGGSFVVEGVGGIESDHGFSITQGGALSSYLARDPPRLSWLNSMSDNAGLSDMIRNAPKFGKNFAFDRWTAFPGVGFLRPGLRLNDRTRSRRKPGCVEPWRP